MERALCRRRKRRKSGLYESAVNVFGTRIIKGGDVDRCLRNTKFQGRVIFSLGCNNESFQSRPAHSRRPSCFLLLLSLSVFPITPFFLSPPCPSVGTRPLPRCLLPATLSTCTCHKPPPPPPARRHTPRTTHQTPEPNSTLYVAHTQPHPLHSRSRTKHLHLLHFHTHLTRRTCPRTLHVTLRMARPNQARRVQAVAAASSHLALTHPHRMVRDTTLQSEWTALKALRCSSLAILREFSLQRPFLCPNTLLLLCARSQCPRRKRKNSKSSFPMMVVSESTDMAARPATHGTTCLGMSLMPITTTRCPHDQPGTDLTLSTDVRLGDGLQRENWRLSKCSGVSQKAPASMRDRGWARG